MNPTSYDEKIKVMLGDERTYTKLKFDPTPKYLLLVSHQEGV